MLLNIYHKTLIRLSHLSMIKTTLSHCIGDEDSLVHLMMSEGYVWYCHKSEGHMRHWLQYNATDPINLGGPPGVIQTWRMENRIFKIRPPFRFLRVSNSGNWWACLQNMSKLLECWFSWTFCPSCEKTVQMAIVSSLLLFFFLKQVGTWHWWNLVPP